MVLVCQLVVFLRNFISSWLDSIVLTERKNQIFHTEFDLQGRTRFRFDFILLFMLLTEKSGGLIMVKLRCLHNCFDSFHAVITCTKDMAGLTIMTMVF